MMTSFLLSAGILLASMMLPLSAHAYVSPEEALYDDSYRFFEPPPSTRETKERAAAQRETSAERRERELQAAIEESKQAQEPTIAATDDEDEPLYGAAPTDASSPQLEEIFQELQELKELQNSPEARAQRRLLERIEQSRLEDDLRSAASLHVPGYGEPLRSGAPLADTGPATVIGAVVIGAAGLWTWRRARNNAKAFS